jgi:hypothetical protein
LTNRFQQGRQTAVALLCVLDFLGTLHNDLLERKETGDGHTHESFDYEIGKTRVVCNPRGYASTEENKGFRPDYTFVV